MNRKTISTALLALSLVTVSAAAQAQTFAWEANISNSPVLEQSYNAMGDSPSYESTLIENFGK